MAKPGGMLTYHGQDTELELGDKALLVNPGSVSGIGAPNVDEALIMFLPALFGSTAKHNNYQGGSRDDINSQLMSVAYGSSMKQAGLDGHVFQPERLWKIATRKK